MSIYTVHEPPARKNEIDADPERFVFVRDGFHFWAFLLGPLWMLWHRLWLVLPLYLLATGAVQAALWALGVSAAVKFGVGFLIALLVGFEAASLRRWTYARRRWGQAGLVVAPDPESAEHRFFESWVARKASGGPAASPQQPGHWTPQAAPQVVGLFPEPQSHP